MRIAGRRARLRGRIAFWALAGVALLASHDAIFLAQVGPGEELTRVLRNAGHGYWGAASLVLALIGLAGAIGAAVRLINLYRYARRLDARPTRARSFAGRLVVTWSWLFAVVAVGFVAQESVEHLAMHGHAIGLGALIGPEYPLAMPVIGLITVAAAVIATAVAGVERGLVATIQAALRRLLRRAPRQLGRAPLSLVLARISLIGNAAAGRAPPRMLVSAT
jgi:hypothetical protein